MPLATATGLSVRDAATGRAWAFGADDPDVQHRTDGGLTGWRIVRDGLDVRLTFGVPPGGNAAVFRLDATNTGADARALVLESTVEAGGVWQIEPRLHARLVEAQPGVWLAHTFVPDDGRMTGSDDADALRRTATLTPGETAGWTVGLGVGATARDTLAAVFPHLSGDRSRAALAAAKRK